MKNMNRNSNRHVAELRLYFSDAYTAAAKPFDTMQKAGWIVQSLRGRPIPLVELVAPEPLTVDQMMKVHEAAYVEALRTGEPRSLAESCGFAWDLGLWTSVTASNAGLVAAADAMGREAIND